MEKKRETIVHGKRFLLERRVCKGGCGGVFWVQSHSVCEYAKSNCLVVCKGTHRFAKHVFVQGAGKGLVEAKGKKKKVLGTERSGEFKSITPERLGALNEKFPERIPMPTKEKKPKKPLTKEDIKMATPVPEDIPMATQGNIEIVEAVIVELEKQYKKHGKTNQAAAVEAAGYEYSQYGYAKKKVKETHIEILEEVAYLFPHDKDLSQSAVMDEIEKSQEKSVLNKNNTVLTMADVQQKEKEKERDLVAYAAGRKDEAVSRLEADPPLDPERGKRIKEIEDEPEQIDLDKYPKMLQEDFDRMGKSDPAREELAKAVEELRLRNLELIERARAQPKAITVQLPPINWLKAGIVAAITVCLATATAWNPFVFIAGLLGLIFTVEKDSGK